MADALVISQGIIRKALSLAPTVPEQFRQPRERSGMAAVALAFRQ
jgi:hypothetical protein